MFCHNFLNSLTKREDTLLHSNAVLCRRPHYPSRFDSRMCDSSPPSLVPRSGLTDVGARKVRNSLHFKDEICIFQQSRMLLISRVTTFFTSLRYFCLFRSSVGEFFKSHFRPYCSPFFFFFLFQKSFHIFSRIFWPAVPTTAGVCVCVCVISIT